ncbi:NYN domain-containing protein [Fictibacillus sp. Mic-4]|uniref:LabA-like NYN domain-containing protein n=1 Tax=Fictibacillus TaxID=1329200 RepID=UPI00041DF4BD|nr:NYN domain-containing protein [Fictibacillus gelatini]HAJ3957194.1 NYN domain-containing protein [Escherichia coli]
MERVMIFIDANNFYHACKHYLNQPPKYDFEKLCNFIVNKRPNRHLLRTYFYTVNEPVQNGIIGYLKTVPRTTVKMGTLLKNKIPQVVFDPSNPKTYVATEKGTDVNLTTDLLIGAYMNSYDTAIIISGDTDYMTPIEEVKKIGKIVEVVITKGQSTDLKKVADEYFELDEKAFEEIWRGEYISKKTKTPSQVGSTT